MFGNPYFGEEMVLEEELFEGFGGGFGNFGRPMTNQTQIMPDLDGGFAIGPKNGIGFDPLDGDLTLDVGGVAFDL